MILLILFCIKLYETPANKKTLEDQRSIIVNNANLENRQVALLEAQAADSILRFSPQHANDGFKPVMACPFDDTKFLRCNPWAFTNAANFAVSVHTSRNFTLATYGTADFVSRVSSSGSKFFEQDVTDLIILLLGVETVAAGALLPAKGSQATNGLCVGSSKNAGVWFLDVGANIGVHAVAVASAGFPAIAVEATPSTAERLRCSRVLNQLPHLHVVQGAVHHKGGLPLCIGHWAGNFGGNAMGESTAACPHESQTISLRLDELLDPGKWRQGQVERNDMPFIQQLSVGPTVMKMDVEGFEGLALEGYSNLFGTLHLPAYIFLELAADSLARTGHGHTVRGILLDVMGKGPGYRAYRGDLALEISREAISSFTGAESAFIGQKDCLGNYVLVRSDVQLPALDRFYNFCKAECC